MTGTRRERLASPTQARDPSALASPAGYTELLSLTRGLRGDQLQARDAWFASLAVERKDVLLFELEILLKGVVCFSNPRNHPGRSRRTPVVAIDFSNHLAHWKAGGARVIFLARQLLGSQDRTFVFQRYLETVLPEDMARTRLVHEGLAQDSPEASLFVLRHALTQTLEVTDGVLRLSRIPYRLFYALIATAQREISRNAFFNPLSALEFRPEFDRITSADVLRLIEGVPSGHTRRLVALTFLSLFRMLRYVRLVEQIALLPTEDKRQTCGRIYLVLSVLRSDARALTGYLGTRAGVLLSTSFEDEILSAPASQLREREQALTRAARRMLAIKAALEGIAANLRMEIRRTFEHAVPAPDSAASDDEVRLGARRLCVELKPAMQNAILLLSKSLDPAFSGVNTFDDDRATLETAMRQRRDVWMFAQIVRAFTTKVSHARIADDRWTAATGFGFVREFLAYFRALGYPLLLVSDYSGTEDFLGAMSALADVDLLDGARIEAAIRESKALYAFLLHFFDEVSARDVLRGMPFDRRAAAEALKLCLGD